MLRFILSYTFLSFFLCLFSENAHAADINTNNYDIYIGDIDGDGTKDFLFKPKMLPLILHGDIAIPILIARGVGFVIFRSGNNFKLPIEFNLFSQSDIAAKLANGSLKKAELNTDFVVLTNDSLGRSRLLLKSNVSGVWDLVLTGSSNTSLPIMDVKSSSSSSPAAGSPQLAWQGVVSGMINNNPNAMLQYFDPRVINSYTTMFNILGKQLSEIGNQLGEIQPLYISENMAFFLVPKKGDDGSDNLHTIKFLKDSSGSWKVNQL